MCLPTCCLLLALSFTAYPPKPVESKKVDSFDSLMLHIKGIAAKDEWKKEGWKDEALQDALNLIIKETKAATKAEGLKLPVTFSEVAAGEGGRIGRNVEKALIVIKGNDLTPLLGGNKSCILLIDGSTRLTNIEDSIVIATGSVQISRGSRNLVIARRGLTAMSDGDRNTGGDGSVLISGGTVDGMLYGSIVNAPRGVNGLLLNKPFTTINTPNNRPAMNLPNAAAITEIKDAKLTFEPKPKPNPLEGKITIVEALPPLSTRTSGGIIVRMNNVEIVIRPGAEVTDNNGKPIPELAGWKLEPATSSLLSSQTVVFTKNDEEAVFELKPTARPLLNVAPAVVPPGP